jgi:hypothetical protein
VENHDWFLDAIWQFGRSPQIIAGSSRTSRNNPSQNSTPVRFASIANSANIPFGSFPFTDGYYVKEVK